MNDNERELIVAIPDTGAAIDPELQGIYAMAAVINILNLTPRQQERIAIWLLAKAQEKIVL